MIVRGLERIARELEEEPYSLQVPGLGVWHKRPGEPFLPLDQIRGLLKRPR